MKKELITYRNDDEVTRAYFIIPGFTDGLKSELACNLREYVMQQQNAAVFGLLLAYRRDIVDDYRESQQFIFDTITEYQQNNPTHEIFIFGISLGGALSFYGLHNVTNISLTILGLPLRVGWPCRISLLSAQNPQLPDYVTEYKPIFENFAGTFTIINGGADDLTDNETIESYAAANLCMLHVIDGAHHSFNNKPDLFQQIKKYLPI
jgi:dienelactone hydrolase